MLKSNCIDCVHCMTCSDEKITEMSRKRNCNYFIYSHFVTSHGKKCFRFSTTEIKKALHSTAMSSSKGIIKALINRADKLGITLYYTYCDDFKTKTFLCDYESYIKICKLLGEIYAKIY